MKRGYLLGGIIFLGILLVLAFFIVPSFTGNVVNEESTSKTTTYIYAGNLLASVTDNGTEYYVQDHLGTNRKVTDGSDFDSYAFGETENAVGDEDYLYAGKELDSETGLYYYGARYYAPELGRFVQSDAVMGDLNDPLSMNRYAYVKNNPLKYVDPSGNAEAYFGIMGSSQFTKGYMNAWGISSDGKNLGGGIKAQVEIDFLSSAESFPQDMIHPTFGAFSLDLSKDTKFGKFSLEHESSHSLSRGTPLGSELEEYPSRTIETVRTPVLEPYQNEDGSLGINQVGVDYQNVMVEHQYFGESNLLLFESSLVEGLSVGIGEGDSYSTANNLLDLEGIPPLVSGRDSEYSGFVGRYKKEILGGTLSLAGGGKGKKSYGAIGFSSKSIKLGNGKASISACGDSSGNCGASLKISF